MPGRSKGNGQGASYSDKEVNDCLLLMHEISSIGSHEWNQVVEKHKQKYKALDRDASSL